MLNMHHMHTWVCTVFKWNYEQHLYTHTLIPIINRFASTNEPLSVVECLQSHWCSKSWTTGWDSCLSLEMWLWISFLIVYLLENGNKDTHQNGSIPRNACVACKTALRYYQESVTTGQTYGQIDAGQCYPFTDPSSLIPSRHKIQSYFSSEEWNTFCSIVWIKQMI